MDEELPLVSVIIPTWNSERTLDLCLRSVINQTYKKIEVIVVDGGSVDNTPVILQKYKDKLKIIKSEKHNRSFQRNIGAFHACGELFLFVDSDEALDPMLIEECVNKILVGKFEALFLPTFDTGVTYFGKSRHVGDCINLTMRKEKWIPNSMVRFCTKTVFQMVKGYDENLLIGEDVIFTLKCIRHKFRIDRCKRLIFHYATEVFKDIFTKKYVYGRTYKNYKEAYKKFYSPSPSKMYAEVGIFYLKNLFKFKKLAKYIPGFLFVKLIEMLGLILGAGIRGFFHNRNCLSR
jgi:glycosyltransferase involved in cell wall biosynthesis